MASHSESIVLFGGPKDGTVIEVDAHPPLEYRIPIPIVTSIFTEPGDFIQPEMRVGIYAPRIDKYGKVLCNLAGHPIYEWRGEQT
jgi:hypothetical protein